MRYQKLFNMNLASLLDCPQLGSEGGRLYQRLVVDKEVERYSVPPTGMGTRVTHRSKTTQQVGKSFLVASIVLLLAACEDTIDPEEVCESGVTLCWSTRDAANLVVNGEPYESRLLPGAVQGYRIPTRVGASYTLIVGQQSGQLRYYVSSGTRVDPGVNTIADRRYPGKFSFSATSDVYSVIIQDQGQPEGTTYSIRVYSYDEPSVPLPNTRNITVNEGPISFSLLRNALIRFQFTTEQGRDYEVQIDVTQGRVTTYLSVIASVDADVHEFMERGVSQRIIFRAEQDGRMYIAVQDQNQVTGSDFLIRVLEY